MTKCKFTERLQAPFDPSDIEWKPQTSGFSKSGNAPYVLAVPYVTNRAIQKRLDEVFGVFGWENEYKPAQGIQGYLCGISVYNEDGRKITRWDGAEATHIEPLKGGLSNSMKRAAVQLGIGRYLYQLDEFWAQCVATDNYGGHDGYEHIIRKNNKNNYPKHIAWKNPEFPAWALPVLDFTEYGNSIVNAETISELMLHFQTAWRACDVNQATDRQQEFKKMYDRRRSELETKAAENIAKDTKQIEIWIKEQAKGIKLVPTISAAETVYKRLTESLEKQCDGTYVDKEALAAKLKGYYDNHVKNLNKGTQQ